MTRSTSSHFICAALFAFSTLVAIPAPAVSQGAAGGSLGNDNKSLSGASEQRQSAPARRARSERQEAPRRESKRGGGGGGGGFDGAWVVMAVGVTCSGNSRNAVIVSSGRIIGNNVTSGTVSSSGAVYATGGSGGLTNVTTGRLSGRGGGGTFRQSDGCTGRWTASKQ